MNELLMKRIAFLSAMLGLIAGVITVIPFICSLSFLALMVLAAVIVIVYMKKKNFIGYIEPKEGSIYGAIIGFISFIGFSIVFAPISMILGWLIPAYTLGFLRFFMGGVGTFIVMLFLIIFMGGISALFNGFGGLVTAYVYELITGIKKENNQNSSVDFEIK